MKITRVNTNPDIVNLTLQANKNFPNSRLPVIQYKNALVLPRQKNKAAEIAQQIFIRNGWSNSWRDGIYKFHHYHSNTHECMAVCLGEAVIMLGGPGGKKMVLRHGDVLILPAGAGHKCLRASQDFLTVGAYPQGKDYDINYGKASELQNAKSNIQKVSIPRKDPVFGSQGFLKTYWK